MSRLDWLFKNSEKGDHVVFHFSGHGSQILDLNGDEKERSFHDIQDELLCLYDFDWDDPKSYLLDDDIAEWTAKKPEGVGLTIVLDCCHSGTGTRNLIPFSDADEVSRFIEPPVDLRARLNEAKDIPVRKIASTNNEENHTLFAGCRENQTSADAYIDGDYNGAFTYYLCKTIRDFSNVYTLRNQDVIDYTRRFLSNNRYTQIPQLETVYFSSPIFGGAL